MGHILDVGVVDLQVHQFLAGQTLLGSGVLLGHSADLSDRQFTPFACRKIAQCQLPDSSTDQPCDGRAYRSQHPADHAVSTFMDCQLDRPLIAVHDSDFGRR